MSTYGRSDDPRWVSCSGNTPVSNRWTATSEMPPDQALMPPPYAGGYTATLPAPPRPPRLAALLSRANELGLQSSYYDRDNYQRREVHHFNCWRLRWCALCLVIAVALQASTVGSHVHAFFASSAPQGSGAELFGSVALLSLLLVALWSLLSQLLLWSDAAVMKVPKGVHVSADVRRDPGVGSPQRGDADEIQWR